jgi:acetylornithine/N-succinyldiaminopimelate aminotransferase
MNPEKRVSRKLFDDVMVPNYAPFHVIPVRGEGSFLWDQDGNKYIDFSGGIAVSALGHAHPMLVKVLKEQGEKLWHVSNYLTNEPALRLAEKLCAATFAEKVFFANSGGEANEAALKLARRYVHDNHDVSKDEIISFKGSFHGRTLFTVTAGGQKKYTEGFGPLPGSIRHIEYNSISEAEKSIGAKTCAVIVETIQGEGGIINGNKEFLVALRRLCTENNALLIFDEVQTGFGRCGHLYSYMKYGVEPDILTSAKGLGCGFPIGAMLTKTDIAKSFAVGTHGCTYGGGPLATAIAEKALDIIDTEEVLAGVKRKHSLFREHLQEINNRFGIFDEIRGDGLLIGLLLNDTYKGRAGDFVKAALRENLMILVAGPDVIRFAPSLIIPDDIIDLGMKKFSGTLERVLNEK